MQLEKALVQEGLIAFFIEVIKEPVLVSIGKRDKIVDSKVIALQKLK